MKKRILVILITLLVTVLTGCGQKVTEDGEDFYYDIETFDYNSYFPNGTNSLQEFVDKGLITDEGAEQTAKYFDIDMSQIVINNEEKEKTLGEVLEKTDSDYALILVASSTCNYCSLFKDNHINTNSSLKENISNINLFIDLTVDFDEREKEGFDKDISYLINNNKNDVYGSFLKILSVPSMIIVDKKGSLKLMEIGVGSPEILHDRLNEFGIDYDI